MGGSTPGHRRENPRNSSQRRAHLCRGYNSSASFRGSRCRERRFFLAAFLRPDQFVYLPWLQVAGCRGDDYQFSLAALYFDDDGKCDDWKTSAVGFVPRGDRPSVPLLFLWRCHADFTNSKNQLTSEFQRWYKPPDLSVESIPNRKSKILKPPHLFVGSPLKSKISNLKSIDPFHNYCKDCYRTTKIKKAPGMRTFWRAKLDAPVRCLLNIF